MPVKYSAALTYSLLWSVIWHCDEIFITATAHCSFRHPQVIAATADKASCSAKHVRMQAEADHPYRVRNRFAPGNDERYIYFISDAPHLMKTIRNNLYNSGDGAHTKYLWVCIKFHSWER